MEEQAQSQETPQETPQESPRKSGLWKIQAVIFEPRKAFEELRRHPTFLLPLVLSIVVGLLGAFLLLQVVGNETVFELLRELSPRARQQEIPAEQVAVVTKYVIPAQFYGIALLLPLIGVFAGSGIYLILLMLFGAEAKYRQTLAVVAHSSFIYALVSGVLNAVVLMVLNDYSGLDPYKPATTGLGFLVDRFNHPALYAAVSAVDLPTFYYLFLAALGLTVMRRSKSMSMGLAVVIIPYLLLVAVGVGMAYVFS